MARFHRPAGIVGAMKSLAFLDNNGMRCAKLRNRIDLSPLPTSAWDAKQEPYFNLGQPDFYGEDGARCLTYADRFTRYTDVALGISYRTWTPQMQDNFDVAEVHPLHGPREMAESDRDQRAQQMREAMRTINRRQHIDGVPVTVPDWYALIQGCGLATPPKIVPGSRTAVILRSYLGATWTEDDILNARAMIVELILARPTMGWGLVIMVEIPSDSKVMNSYDHQMAALETLLPKEFWPFVHFWNPDLGQLLFPGFEIQAPVGDDRYSYKRDCLMAQQILFSFPEFARRYDYVQNWEGDVRFLGDYRTYFDAIDRFARAEPNDPTLQRYQDYFIPGSNISEAMLRNSTVRLADQPRDQPADLIVQSPIWNARAHWYWRKGVDATNYDERAPILQSCVAAFRLSARLVHAYNRAMLRHRKSMFCEAWPATVVRHSHMLPAKGQTFETAEELALLGEAGPMKAVYPAHPIRFDRKPTTEQLEGALLLKTGDPDDLMRHSSHHYQSFNAKSVFYGAWRMNGTCERPHLIHPVKDTW